MNNTNINAATTRPAHHIHDTSEPLPGVKGAAHAPDYSTSTMDRTPSSTWKDQQNIPREEHPARGVDSTAAQPPLPRSNSGRGNVTFNTERPTDGGVAIDGHENVPAGKVGMADKLVGKTQKAIGKYTHKSEMLEKGELRAAGGKTAVRDQASVPHD